MELVNIAGERKPRMIYTPYVYAVIEEFSIFYLRTDHNGKTKAYLKEGGYKSCK